jgi:PLD-like domain
MNQELEMNMKQLMFGRFAGLIVLLVACSSGTAPLAMAEEAPAWCSLENPVADAECPAGFYCSSSGKCQRNPVSGPAKPGETDTIDEELPAEDDPTQPPADGVAGLFPDSLIARYGALPTASIHRFNSGSPDFFVAHNPLVVAKTAPSSPPMNVVEDTALELIRRAPAGATINIAFFRLTTKDFDAAIQSASLRGVRIYIILGAVGSKSSTEAEKVTRRGQLRGFLGTNGTLKECSNGSGSCIGDVIMHNKFITLSEVCRLGVGPVGACIPPAAGAGPKSYANVVYQGTQNLQSIERTHHNVAAVIIDNPAFYTSYQSYFAKLKSGTTNLGFNGVLGKSTHNGIRMGGHLFPNSLASDGQDPFKLDVVVRQLDAVNCNFQAPEERPIVRIAMGHWTYARGRAIADRLGRLLKAGCSVQVLVPNAVSASGAYSDAFEALTTAKVPMYIYPAEAEGTIHAKYMLIDARYGGSAVRRKIVFFGSMNFTPSAAKRNDETWLWFEQDYANSVMFDELFASYKKVRNRVAAFKPPVTQ